MAVYDNQYISELVTICDYSDQNEILDYVNNLISDYSNTIFDPNQNNPSILALESTNFITNYLSNDDDSCQWKMKNYILHQYIQIPDPLLPALIDPNLLSLLKTDVENMINNSKPLSQIISDMQSLYSSEDPLTIEAWVTYLYNYITFPTSDYYNNLLAQNFSYTTSTIANTADSLYWKEQHIYGSSRLGMYKPDREMVYADIPNVIAGMTRNHFTGMRQYELTNHLGNVLATIKDEKKQMPRTNNLLQAGYYEPIVQFASDYYPFGMPMPNRTYSLSSGSKYRFGFNGKEKDDEVYGAGNLNTAEFWQYDTRLGRRWNLDPKPQISVSDYAVLADNPINCNDILGNVPNAPGSRGNASAKVTEFANKEDTRTSGSGFELLSKENFTKDLNDRIFTVSLFDQGSMNMCGPQTAAAAFMEQDPEQFVDIMISAYSTGSFTCNGKDYKLTNDEKNPVLNGVNGVDYIACIIMKKLGGGSTYTHQNFWEKEGLTGWIGKKADEIQGLTLPTTFTSALTSAGLKVESGIVTTKFSNPETLSSKLSQSLTQGKSVVLLINTDNIIYRNSSNSLPTHYISLNSIKFNEKTGLYEVKYSTWDMYGLDEKGAREAKPISPGDLVKGVSMYFIISK